MTDTNLYLHNTKVLAHDKGATTGKIVRAELVTGSRLILTLYATSGTVRVRIRNRLTVDIPFYEVETLEVVGGGRQTKVLSDVHNLFQFEVEVENGPADYYFGLSVADNMSISNSETRIENAEIDVNLNHVTQANGKYDSVRVGDGEEEISINPDGSINVNIVNTSIIPEVVNNIFNKVTDVAQDIRTLIVSHTAASGKETYLQRINVNGNNTACYEVELNGSVIDEACTYFGGSLRESFEFDGYSENGLIIPPGQTIEVFVEHYRNDNGDFSSRIQILEIG